MGGVGGGGGRGGARARRRRGRRLALLGRGGGRGYCWRRSGSLADAAHLAHVARDVDEAAVEPGPAVLGRALGRVDDDGALLDGRELVDGRGVAREEGGRVAGDGDEVGEGVAHVDVAVHGDGGLAAEGAVSAGESVRCSRGSRRRGRGDGPPGVRLPCRGPAFLVCALGRHGRAAGAAGWRGRRCAGAGGARCTEDVVEVGRRGKDAGELLGRHRREGRRRGGLVGRALLPGSSRARLVVLLVHLERSGGRVERERARVGGATTRLASVHIASSRARAARQAVLPVALPTARPKHYPVSPCRSCASTSSPPRSPHPTRPRPHPLCGHARPCLATKKLTRSPAASPSPSPRASSSCTPRSATSSSNCGSASAQRPSASASTATPCHSMSALLLTLDRLQLRPALPRRCVASLALPLPDER